MFNLCSALNVKKVIDLCQETEDSEKASIRRMNTPSMRSDKLREKLYSTRRALFVVSFSIYLRETEDASEF